MPGKLGTTAVHLAVLVSFAACSGATAAGPASPSGPSAGGSTDADVAAAARARADSARRPYTAADIRFMSDMIVHHAQAIAMARLAEPSGASPSVRTLAGRILNGQLDEIATMQQWLRDRGQPVPEVAADGSVAMPAGGHHAHDAAGPGAPRMAGMLTPAQVDELESAVGWEFDRLFLSYMIQHHRGAIAMVEELFGTYGAGQDETVFRLASDVNVDQITEIERMQRMLVEVLLNPPSQRN